MSVLSLLIGLVILAAVGYFVLSPVLRHAQDAAVTSNTAAELERLHAEREAIYAAIRELDLDHQTGKITGADYTARRAQLTRRGVEVLQAIDRLADVSLTPAAPAARLLRSHREKGQGGEGDEFVD